MYDCILSNEMHAISANCWIMGESGILKVSSNYKIIYIKY